MNADLRKIRTSKLFRNLPDRAFEKISTVMKVRGFAFGEEAIDFSASKEAESEVIYVVAGSLSFFDKKKQLIGFARKGEFFLGRAFSLQGENVRKIISMDDQTIVVFLPKEVMSQLSEASNAIGNFLEEVFVRLDRRSALVREDFMASQLAAWLDEPSKISEIEAWQTRVEMRASELEEQQERAIHRRRLIYASIGFGLFLIMAAAYFIVRSTVFEAR